MLGTLALLVLFLIPSRPTIVERTEYYEVFGSTEHELRAAINKVRPKDHMGESHDALTKWDVDWKYRTVTGTDGCSVVSVATTLQITVLLPRWANRRSGSPLTQHWDKYIAALNDHEQEHTQIAVRAAQTIQQRLSGLDAAPSCQVLEASIKLTADAVIDESRNEEILYDRKTNHGVSQGARFP